MTFARGLHPSSSPFMSKIQAEGETWRDNMDTNLCFAQGYGRRLWEEAPANLPKKVRSLPKPSLERELL